MSEPIRIGESIQPETEVIPLLTDLTGNPRVCVSCNQPVSYKTFAGGDKRTTWCYDCVRLLDAMQLEKHLQ